jgi:hypothetical protein
VARTRAPELDRRLPRIVLGVALALPVLLVVGVLVASQVLGRQTDPDPDTGPLALTAVPVPAAASADCSRLLSGLPQEINTGDGLLPRRVLASPVPAGTVAWGGEKEASGRPEDQPVVLRCGLPQPPELGPTSPLLDVDGVDWLRIPGAGTTTWVTVDRAIFVGLTLPDGIGSGAIQDVSRGVKITLVSRDTEPADPTGAPTTAPSR